MTNIERACEVVYQETTGECWHKQDKNNILRCHKCGMCPVPYGLNYRNPDLATSLDAWREYIFAHMNQEQKRAHNKEILTGEAAYKWSFDLTPIDHLEAALRTLGHNKLAEDIRRQG